MASDRFYVPDPLTLGPASVSGPEAHHLAHVLRLRAGDRMTLFNGDGAEYVAELMSVSKSVVELTVLERRDISRETGRDLTLACPLPKGDRAQFLIEKLTELGVSRYIPLRTERSVVHPGEGKTDKLRRYVIEASKQCGRNVLMQVEAAAVWEELVKSPDLPASRLFAHHSGHHFSQNPATTCLIALGPEGGWTDEEVRLATEHGWQLLSLGRSTLRIETAALAAATLCLLAG